MNVLNNLMEEMKLGRIEKPVKEHLRNVYGAMGIALFTCAVGSYVHMIYGGLGGGLLTAIASVATLLILLAMDNREENTVIRLGLLNGFAFLTGLSLGPLIQISIMINPQIITTAFLGTSLVFICFTLSALMANDRKFLALGGTLLTGISALLVLGIMNIFFGSQLLFQVSLYLGLFVFCGFVLYDTQLIVEKCRQGDYDYIRHCLDLFMDFVGIFRRLVILLTEKEGRERRRRSD